MSCAFRLLGPLEFETAAGTVAISGVRACRLLTVLLLNPNTVVATDRIAEILWESPPRSERQQIHNTVSALRRILGRAPDVALVTAQLGYRLEVDAERIDLIRFRTAVQEAREVAAAEPARAISLLKTGLRLWRGPALCGIEGSYFEGVTTRLDEERLAATELLMDLRVRVGDSALVVGELAELVAANPLRESPRASLMLALHTTGRQVDALDVYEHGRKLLAEEYGLDPSDAMRELHQQILRGDRLVDAALTQDTATLSVTDQATSSAADQVDAPASAGTPAEPGSAEAGTAELASRCFLPHDPREFTGRDREIAHLLRDSRQTGSVSLVISAINGMGGIGKTALAVRFAHTAAADYPHGQLFVDLRGFTIGAEPVEPAEALATLLQQTGQPVELIPRGLDARAAAWRAQMAGKRAIVVIDNVVDAQQVRPLLPGSSGPLVLITSRRRLPSLEGALSLPLDLMPPQDGVALFTEVAGPDRVHEAGEDLSAIVELCGRLPLAIRIAAARFRDRTSWSAHHLATLLSNQEKRERYLNLGHHGVSSVIALSCRYLSAGQSRVFRLLSIHPGPSFDSAVAAVLASVPVDEAESMLESLADDNLISEVGPGRYQFHDLVRACAAHDCAEHENSEARQVAHLRLVDFWLHCARTWCRPLAVGPFRMQSDTDHGTGTMPGIPEPDSPAEALVLLTEAYNDLVEVARSALNSTPSKAWRLACSLQPLFRYTHYAGAALELYEGAAEAARSVGDLRGEALCLATVGFIQREQRRHDLAASLLQSAISLSGRAGDRVAETYFMAELGNLWVNTDQPLLAYGQFRSALAVAEGLDDPELVVALWISLGQVCRETGRNAESYTYLAKSMAYYEDAGQGQHLGYLMAHLGFLHVQTNRFAEAVDSFERVLRTGSEPGPPNVVAGARTGLCVALRALGDLAQALEYGRAALNLARECALLTAECEALNAIGEVHLADGDLAAAALTFQNAAELAHDRHVRSVEARAHEGLAHVALRRGDLDSALRMWEHALSLYPPDIADAENCRVHLSDNAAQRQCLRCTCQRRSPDETSGK